LVDLKNCPEPNMVPVNFVNFPDPVQDRLGLLQISMVADSGK